MQRLRVVKAAQQFQELRQRTDVAVLRARVVSNPPLRAADYGWTREGRRVGKKIHLQRIGAVVDDLIEELFGLAIAAKREGSLKSVVNRALLNLVIAQILRRL